MTRFEYKILAVTNTKGVSDTIQESADCLTVEGQEGWELVSTTLNPFQVGFIFFLKRAVPEGFRAKAPPKQHLDHGKSSDGEGPDDCDCPCRGTKDQVGCAEEGCGFCQSSGECVPKTETSGVVDCGSVTVFSKPP